MNKKVQRVIVIVLAAALLLTVMIPALSLFVGAEVTKGDIDNIKGELAQIQAQKRETEQRLKAVRNDLARAREQMDLIESQVVLTEAQINASQQLLDQYDIQIADKEREIRELEEQEAQQYQEFYDQVRWMEETGSVSYVSILFEASSFQELLDYAMLISDIMEYSNRIIDRLQATQEELAQARDELHASRNEQVIVQEELEGQKAELEQRRAEQHELLLQIAASESALAKEARLQAESEAKINKELKEAEAKYAAQLAEIERKRKEEEAKANAAAAARGAWYWPVPGYYGISSIFGSRYIFGRWESHTGTDIPAPANTPIYAASDGIVTTVNTNRYASTYGYYCTVSHGGGYVTLYAHQVKAPIVKVGDTVTKGQIIGYVGSTGNSTGNHLHFELRINGVRGDILQLYPNLTFTGYGTSWKGKNYPW